MATIIATTMSSDSAKGAAKKIGEELKSQMGESKPLLVMAFASTKQPLTELMPVLSEIFPESVILGSSTAGEFTQDGDAKGSVSAFALAGEYKVAAGMGKGLKENMMGAVDQAVSRLPVKMEGYPHRTGIILLDALSGNAEETVLTVAEKVGLDVRMAGGAAGDDLAMSKTFVALGPEVRTDAVVVGMIYSKIPLGVGVSHGHEPVSGPLKITKAEGNVVHEIEGRPAWDVWAENTREAAARIGLDPHKLGENEVGSYLIRYEAGLATGDEYKIRVPLGRQADGALNFACGIPQSAVIRITESEPSRQIDSVHEAVRRAKKHMGDHPVAGALVFDCVCRKIILEDQFGTAVKAMREDLGNVRLAGFETYGEIAMDAGDMSGFHNTTTVVLAFPV